MESGDGAEPFMRKEDRKGKGQHGEGDKLHLHQGPRTGLGKGCSAWLSWTAMPRHPTPALWGTAAPTVTPPASRQHFTPTNSGVKSMDPPRSHKGQLDKQNLPLKVGWRSSPARPLPSAYPSIFLRKQKKRK